MSDTDPQEVGRRIEALLGELGEPAVAEVAEELVRLLMGMYGAGLERIVSMLVGSALEGPALLSKLLEDDLVSSLLVLHDLHPEDTEARVVRALETVRPYLGSHAGGVELLGVANEPEGTVVMLRLRGSCDGCPSSAMTVKTAIEKAIVEACPEVLRVDVEGMGEPSVPAKELPLLQIQSGPPVEVSWVVADDLSLQPGQCATLDVEGYPVLLALPSGSGGLVAYRNSCPACRNELDGAALTGNRLFCPSCQAGYDVRKAGRALTGGLHLEPLPLVTRAGGLRMAIPSPAVGAPS